MIISALKKIGYFPRHLYKEYWLQFLVWFGSTKLMGGAAHAESRGNIARVGRILSNILTLAGFIGGIATIGLTTWFTGGLALPIWAIVCMSLGITTNFLLLPIHSAANTAQIQKYYNKQFEILEKIRKKANKSGEEPPHGLFGCGDSQ